MRIPAITARLGSTLAELLSKRALAPQAQGREDDGDSWIEWMYDYVDRVRVRDTGLVREGSGDLVNGMNGLFKLRPGSFVWTSNATRRPFTGRVQYV